MDNPLVSIITPVRNGIAYTAEISFHITEEEKKLIMRLKNALLKYEAKIVLAVNQTATDVALKYVPGNVIFWSMDLWATDCVWSNTEVVHWKSEHHPGEEMSSAWVTGTTCRSRSWSATS